MVSSWINRIKRVGAVPELAFAGVHVLVCLLLVQPVHTPTQRIRQRVAVEELLKAFFCAVGFPPVANPRTPLVAKSSFPVCYFSPTLSLPELNTSYP